MTSQPPRSIFERLTSIEFKEIIIGLSIGLAFVSLFFSIHSDIFAQDEERLSAYVYKPWQRIISSTQPPIELSSLLTPRVSQQISVPNNSQPAILSKDKDTPLYIFAIDVSSSMMDQSVSSDELTQYFIDIKNPQINMNQSPTSFIFLPENASTCKTFGIAQAELCRFMHSVPDGSHVALYQFGREVEQLVPAEKTDDRYITFEPTKGGGHSRKLVLDRISSLTANQDQTNFEKLLYKLSLTYRNDIRSRREVHFVIISDFAHDIGGGEYLRSLTQPDRTTTDQSIWESKYRISSIRIANLLREMSRDGTTFHLAAVLGTRRVICGILPIVGETLEMFSYRETQLIPNRVGKEFDFLRSYQESQTPLVFYYSPGSSKSLGTQIRIDDAKYADSSIRLALASEANVHQVFPLKIDVNNGKTNAVLRLDNGGFNVQMERQGDWLWLRSLSILQPREAATYRLLISWIDPNSSSDEGARIKTFTVPIVFYQQLSSLSAWSIVLSELFVLFFAVCLVIQVVKRIRRMKEREEEIAPSKQGAMAARAPVHLYDSQGRMVSNDAPNESPYNADRKQ
ncbi:MAG: hypothetical protein V7641_2113 [Blastocatellia bacterium]